ncbi:hypothetical protein GCM10020331_086430 [Ectobacillus funiculus]
MISFSVLAEITEVVSKDRLIVQPSSSLLHVPVTVKKNEEALDEILTGALAFADEKNYMKLLYLQKGLQEGKRSDTDRNHCECRSYQSIKSIISPKQYRSSGSDSRSAYV